MALRQEHGDDRLGEAEVLRADDVTEMGPHGALRSETEGQGESAFFCKTLTTLVSSDAQK